MSAETTKASRTLIPCVAIQKKKKTMAAESDWCVQQHHLEYSTPCLSISSVNIADETLLPSEPRRLSLSLALSRRVSSNYRPRSPLSWGFFHPIKFYYKDWQWPSRGQRIGQEASSAYLNDGDSLWSLHKRFRGITRWYCWQTEAVSMLLHKYNVMLSSLEL